MSTDAEKIRHLNDLVLNSPDFDRLQQMVGHFNIFRVLRLEHYEIRHSNMLAWLLDPKESHGLDDVFLRRWLMRVLHDFNNTDLQTIQVMSWEIRSVEVRREWKNIDVLVVITLGDGEKWVIALENKVGFKQGKAQLSRYQKKIDDEFNDTHRRLFIFLTRDGEQPAEDAKDYLMADYGQIHRALKDSLGIKSPVLGFEPKILIENYRRLLEEQFMEDSEIANLARKIYAQHKEALDLIIEHKPDWIRDLSDTLSKALKEIETELSYSVIGVNKFYIRLLPKSWNSPSNHGRGAWGGVNASVLLDVNLGIDRVKFTIVAGNTPEPWSQEIWENPARFGLKQHNRGKKPRKFLSFHILYDHRINHPENQLLDVEEIVKDLIPKFVESYNSETNQKVIQNIAEFITQMPD